MADTELEGMKTARIPGKTAEELETGMNKIAEVYGEPVSIGARTRAAFKAAKPHAVRTVWWAMLIQSGLVLALDMNVLLDGALGSGLVWVHENVFRQMPSLAYIGGMAACYFIWIRRAMDSRG